jgi:hypothetical protein
VKVLGRPGGWLLSLGIAIVATFAGSGYALAQSGAMPDFGSPPSGEIPILFNDHHVYAKPDKLRANRVLAAIVKDGTILVPLRSMFEQMGATVSYDPATQSVDVTKPGADVKVTVGKPIVTINGEDRPLDVPPEIYRGVLVVPVRVISEGMGAYVQWLGDKHTVVVRYNALPPSATPAPPPPPPAPTAPPPPPPVATQMPVATPAPTPRANEAFVAADYDISPKVWNELSPGNSANSAYHVKAAIELPVLSGIMLAGDYQTLSYIHNSNFGSAGCTPGSLGCNTVNGHDVNYQSGLCPSPDPGCVTVVGFQQVQAFNGLGQAYVPAFKATESNFDARLGFKIADPRIYVGIAGFFKHYNYLGYPNTSGFGVGAEKLPDLDQPFSVYASGYYYPNVQGNYTYPTSVFLGPLSGQTIKLGYATLTYQGGVTIDLGKTPIFLDLGYEGEHSTGRQNAPANNTITAPFAGLGLHF